MCVRREGHTNMETCIIDIYIPTSTEERAHMHALVGASVKLKGNRATTQLAFLSRLDSFFRSR